MLKANLKERWGMYCDTDKLVDDTMNLLTKYHHECTEHGVCVMLDTYFTNKAHLIEMFKKSTSYIGNMRICIDIELERTSNASEITRFCENFPELVGAREVIFKYADEDGKTLLDYSRTGVKKFKAKDLCYGNIRDALMCNAGKRTEFRNDGVTIKSSMEYDRFWYGVYGFRLSPQAKLSDATIDNLEQHHIEGKFTVGMKTSRAFNRLCSIYGVDKQPKYNKMFAEYADMVSGLKRKLKFYISLNPLDYLTMSFGKSWSSCHTIDRKNERDMPNSYSGMHCGGVMSYLLDGTSIITYIHDHATEDPEDGKVYRNMFHFNNGTLIQGRIYPQGNDGATDLYKTFRRFMQIELAKLMDLKADDWILKKGSCNNNTRSYGVHYRDYECFSGCNVTYPKEMPAAYNNVVKIGHERICPKCGYEIDDDYDSGMLIHDDCDEAW